MRFEATVTIAQTPEVVWAGLQDPALMARCAGAEQVALERADGLAFRVTVPLTWGQLAVASEAQLVWTLGEEPFSGEVAAQIYVGGSKDAGISTPLAISVSNHIHLSATPGGATTLHWHGRLHPSPAMRSVPPALVRSLVTQHSRAFFTCLKQTLEAV